MVNRLITVRCVPYLAVAIVLTALMAGVSAQTVLTDPTAPPVGFTASSGEAMEGGGSLLQSIKIPKKGKPVAVIGGQEVKLGELYGDSRLIKLTEREAVLEGPSGTEHLMLTPGIEKTNITKKSPAAKRAQSGGKP